jgi:hypothetical protein
MYVFVVQHVHEVEENNEDVKLIGVYSTEKGAHAAVARVSKQPVFGGVTSGFRVSRYEVDRDHWLEGFVTMRTKET